MLIESYPTSGIIVISRKQLCSLSPTLPADTVLILKHAIKSNSAVSNDFLTCSNQSFHQLQCLRSACSKNSNGKTILACLILPWTPTSYTDLLFTAAPNKIQLYIVQRYLASPHDEFSLLWIFEHQRADWWKNLTLESFWFFFKGSLSPSYKYDHCDIPARLETDRCQAHVVHMWSSSWWDVCTAHDGLQCRRRHVVQQMNHIQKRTERELKNCNSTFSGKIISDTTDWIILKRVLNCLIFKNLSYPRTASGR